MPSYGRRRPATSAYRRDCRRRVRRSRGESRRRPGACILARLERFPDKEEVDGSSPSRPTCYPVALTPFGARDLDTADEVGADVVDERRQRREGGEQDDVDRAENECDGEYAAEAQP